MRELIPILATVVLCIAVALSVGHLLGSAEKARSSWAERCAARWSPRPTEYVSGVGCRVMVDGEWWPESAVKVQP